jgi:hypothetical protein
MKKGIGGIEKLIIWMLLCKIRLKNSHIYESLILKSSIQRC